MVATYQQIVQNGRNLVTLCRVGELQHLDAVSYLLKHRLALHTELGTSEQEIAELWRSRHLAEARVVLAACREGGIDPHAVRLHELMSDVWEATMISWDGEMRMCCWHFSDIELRQKLGVTPQDIGATAEEVGRFYGGFLRTQKFFLEHLTPLEHELEEIAKIAKRHQDGAESEHSRSWWHAYDVGKRIRSQLV